MPLIKIQTAQTLPQEAQQPLLEAASQIVAEATGKPIDYVMAVLEPAAGVMMAGRAAPAAFVDVRGIGGVNAATNGAISKAVCDLLRDRAGISPDRVYLTFTDIPAANWGTDGRTFGG